MVTYLQGNCNQEDTLKNATEMRKLGTSSHNVKGKLENQVKKAERWVEEG
jgi:hypothetical protein